MSFSAEVKAELSEQYGAARHCQIAELTAIITLCGRIQITEGNDYRLWIHTENISVARKFYMLLRQTFQIQAEVSVRRGGGQNFMNTVLVKDRILARKVLQAAKLLDECGDIREDLSLGSNLIVQNYCCKRAFIRGAFLASGSISDPEKSYHYEIVTQTQAKALQLRDLINTFGLDSKVTERKNHFLVYLKEGAQLVDILNVMEAHQALMQFENVRIVKEMRNSVNRQVNCETANISKTVEAATKQTEDIVYIREHGGFSALPESLSEIAWLRLEYPEASLKELGSLLSTPIGKSGVNHRLKKLSLIADRLREKAD